MMQSAVLLSLVLALTCADAAEDAASRPPEQTETARPAGPEQTETVPPTEPERIETVRPAEPLTKLRLDVPERVANASATPILILEGVEIGAGEGMTIEVLGPGDPRTNERPTLAISGLVGAPQRELAEPREQMDLVIPLNETAARLLAGRTEITLTVRLRSPGREPLKIRRAFFR